MTYYRPLCTAPPTLSAQREGYAHPKLIALTLQAAYVAAKHLGLWTDVELGCTSTTFTPAKESAVRQERHGWERGLRVALAVAEAQVGAVSADIHVSS